MHVHVPVPLSPQSHLLLASHPPLLPPLTITSDLLLHNTKKNTCPLKTTYREYDTCTCKCNSIATHITSVLHVFQVSEGMFLRRKKVLRCPDFRGVKVSTVHHRVCEKLSSISGVLFKSSFTYLVESGSALLVERFLHLGRVNQLEGGLVFFMVVSVRLSTQTIHIHILVCERHSITTAFNAIVHFHHKIATCTCS